MRGEAVDAGTSSLWLMNQPLPIPPTHRPVVKRSSPPLGGDQVRVFLLNSSDNSNIQAELKTTTGKLLTLVSSESESRGERRWVVHFLLYKVFDISMYFIK